MRKPELRHDARPTYSGGIVALAMLAVALLLSAIEYVQLDRRQRLDLQIQAELMARTASAALVFDHQGEAGEVLRAFERAPAVSAAWIERADGSRIAHFERAEAPAQWLDRHGGQIEANATVMANGQPIGRLSVRAGRGALWRTLAAVSGSALVVLAMAFAFVHLASRRMRANVRVAQDRVHWLAHHDPLTGLANRVTFAAELERAVGDVVRDGRTAALLYLDVDNFKSVNDTLGHAAGDHVLQILAQRMKALLRDSDLVARLGGDEFAVLLRAPAGAEQAVRVAEAMVRQLPRRIDAAGESLRVGVSIGVAVVPLDAATPTDAMHCADVALYQAKRAGKDGYARFTAALGDARRERLNLERDLREALAEGRVELAYQPIFDATGALDSLEALARWRHAERGWVSPAEFIPMAEESGLIVELGLAALTCLSRDLMGWRMRGLHPVPVALNLSSRQFRRESQRTLFLEHLHALDLGPEFVEFELTESSVFEDLDSPSSILPKLQALGYRLALDDFGTGYSSLAYLRRLKCCKLKIDRTFVDGVARSDDAAMLIESIVRVAHAMDMKVVGEGVERASDQVRLLRLGCDLFQGYGLARPLPFNGVAKLLDSFARGDPQMSLVGRATQPRPLFEE